MPKYVIERDAPEAGKMSQPDLKGVAQRSCDVLQEMGPHIQWVESYITNDKIFCVYIAQNEEMIREHAQKGDFPLTKVFEVKSTIDPITAED